MQVEIRILHIVEELLQFLKREGINRSELTQRIGVPPSRITKLLNGDSNLTIDTLVRAGHAVGANLVQTFVPPGQQGTLGHESIHPWRTHDPERLIRITGASMLYGVGREMISHITARSPDGILTLPSVSLSKTHRNLNRRKRQQRRKVTENDGGRGPH